MSKPDLSVEIIFKNEIRCLERCLKSLQPLRERLSMEIVMADTGSDDGSREVAEKYADVLFDFPWINDFSAARNAVIERCSGRWILGMDADMWLDKDIEPLVKLVMRQPQPDCDYCFSVIRNYITRNFDNYTISLGSGLFRSASEPRYVGAIHETPVFGSEGRIGRGLVNQHIILHHDGYVMLNDGSEAGKKKLERNIELIRKELEKDPDNLRTLGEYIDSASGEEDFMDTVRHAVGLVKQTQDKKHGPGVFHRAVQAAYMRGIPEWEEWAQQAQELYPDDYLVRIDISFLVASALTKENRLNEVQPWCREYLRAKRKFEEDKRGMRAAILSSMTYASDGAECTVRLMLANARRAAGDYEGSYAALKDIRFEVLPVERTGLALMNCVQLFLLADDLDFSGLMIKFWEGIQTAAISEKHASDRVAVFLSEGQDYFDLSKSTKRGTLLSTGARQPWEIFMPLAGRCILGDAAALLKCETVEEADAVFARAGDLNEIPLDSLGRVLRLGAKFPPRPLTVEEADILAARLVQNVADYPTLAVTASKRLEDGPPAIPRVVVRRLDLQDRGASVGQLHEVVKIGEHPRILGVLEHCLAFEHLEPGLFFKDAGDKRLQQVSDFELYPVVLVLDHLGNAELVIVEVSRRSPRRDAEHRRGVAASDAEAPVGEPFVTAQVRGVYQHGWLIRLRHFDCPPLLTGAPFRLISCAWRRSHAPVGKRGLPPGLHRLRLLIFLPLS